ncbi:ABC transporter ATP-binding protein [Holdemania filiformis]|uniref:ABC transporter ATP-binding protein n=1 Tax=Holdemania filiformis TaxID=61171 RepID=UPI0026705392|nr:ABC transporter ATP-binding protein [Holdemania filiformis]
MDAILSIEHLHKQYSGFELNDLCLQLNPGEVMGFIGENGAGKTTTIKSILGLIRHDGEVRIFGKPFEQLSERERGQIGVVLDGCHFHDPLTVKRVEQILSGIYPEWERTKFLQLCERFGLPLNKKIKTFSTGMKMKLSIIAALSHNARLLILDEPTSGLDPIVRDEMLDLFYDFIQDETHSILFSSHITTDIEKIADRVTFIHQGRLQFSLPKDVLHDEYGIVKGARSEIEKIDSDSLLAIVPQSLTCQGLVRNREEVRQAFGKLSVEAATLEEIMLCMVKGELR